MLTSDQNGSSKPECSNTTPKLRGGITGKGFQKGFDPKRNLKGRPRSFDQLREFAQDIAHREIPTGRGKKITIAEAILLKLAGAKEPQALKTFLEFAFGKVPDELKATGLESKPVLILHYAHERQNAEQN